METVPFPAGWAPNHRSHRGCSSLPKNTGDLASFFGVGSLGTLSFNNLHPDDTGSEVGRAGFPGCHRVSPRGLGFAPSHPVSFLGIPRPVLTGSLQPESQGLVRELGGDLDPWLLPAPGLGVWVSRCQLDDTGLVWGGGGGPGTP